MWSSKVQLRNPVVWWPSLHFHVPFLITQQLPYTFDNVLIIFQCPDSQVLESQVVVKKEIDLVSVKE